MGNIECCAEDEISASQRGSVARPSVIEREDKSKAQRFVKSKSEWSKVMSWFRECEDGFSEYIAKLDMKFEDKLNKMVKLKEEEPIPQDIPIPGHTVMQRLVDKEAFIEAFNLEQEQNQHLKEVFMTTEFFKIESQPEYLDFTKLMLFFALYDRSATKEDRIAFLFEMLADEEDSQANQKKITWQNKTSIMIVDIMVTLTCKFSALIVADNYRNDEDEDDLDLKAQFDELSNVLIKTESMDKQFVQELIRKKVFGGSIKEVVTINDFVKNMSKHNNMLVIAEMIRNEYIYFVNIKENPDDIKESLTSVFDYDSDVRGSVMFSQKSRGSGQQHSVRQSEPVPYSKEQKLETQKSKSRGNHSTVKSNSTRKTSPQPHTTPGPQGGPPESTDRQSIALRSEQVEEIDLDGDDDDDDEKVSDGNKSDEGDDVEIEKHPLERESLNLLAKLSQSDADFAQEFRASNRIEMKSMGSVTAQSYKRNSTVKVEMSANRRSKIKSDMHESEEEEKSDFINDIPIHQVKDTSENDEEGETPGPCDQRFGQLVLGLDFENKAAQGTLKKQNESVDINFEKRLLYKRTKRFDENKKALRKADENNRKKLGLFGPQTTKEMQKYTSEVQEILKSTQAVLIEELWNWQCGMTRKKNEASKMMNVFFSIQQELVRTRQKASLIQEETSDAKSNIGNTNVYFLEVGFLKYWNYLVASDDPEKKEVLAAEVKYMRQFDVILFLYFPKMPQAVSPTGGRDDRSSHSGRSSTPGGTPQMTMEEQQEKFHNEYTPFLVELIPKGNQVKLYYKPLLNDADQYAEDNLTQKQLKISALCMDIFGQISKSKGQDFEQSMVYASAMEIPVNNWEEFVVVCSYIAECHTYKRLFKLNDVVMQHERNKFVDLFVQLLRFE